MTLKADPVTPGMVLSAPAATAVADAFLPNDDDDVFAPPKLIFPAQLFIEVPLVYVSTFLSLFSKVTCRESAQCSSRYQELKEHPCEMINIPPEHHALPWQLLQIQPRYYQAVTKLLAFWLNPRNMRVNTKPTVLVTELLANCNAWLAKVRLHSRRPLQSLLRRHPAILLTYMEIFASIYPLCRLFSDLKYKLLCSKPIKLKIVKRFSIPLFKKGLIPANLHQNA